MSIIDTSPAPIPGEIEQSLLKSLGTIPVKPRGKRPSTCEGCGKKVFAFDKHHIVYLPEVIAKLCRPCHKRITAWNTKAVTLLHHKLQPLTNVERVKIWIRFTQETGRVKTLAMASNRADNQKPVSSPSLNLRDTGREERGSGAGAAV
jgi:hypothetical protein